MSKILIKSILILLINISSFVSAKPCTGGFVNPINDVDWDGLFPITIGSKELIGSNRADTKNPHSPICICKKKVGNTEMPIATPGIIGGFWDPARLVDVSAEPYCFVNMGGLEIDFGFERGQMARPKASSHRISQWYMHYYIFPILSLLEIFAGIDCLDEKAFDVLYMSELDPAGIDDELTMILHPEGFLFNNLLAQTACSADCISSSLPKSLPMDALYWCAGCQGPMFPLNGNVNAHIGGVQASLNAAEKMTFKMHRQFLAHETSSSNIKDICHKRLTPQMKKSHYRYQMVNPNPDAVAPFGSTTTLLEAQKETPIIGEDFGYLIWRKTTCCIQ